MFLSPGCHTGQKVALVSGAEYTTGVGVGSVARVLWEGERLEAWGSGREVGWAWGGLEGQSPVWGCHIRRIGTSPVPEAAVAPGAGSGRLGPAVVAEQVLG